MHEDDFTNFMRVRNDALDAAIDKLTPLFGSLQILADATAKSTKEGDAPRTVDFRRGHGNHNARIHLCRKQVERDEHERSSKTLMNISAEDGR